MASLVDDVLLSPVTPVSSQVYTVGFDASLLFLSLLVSVSVSLACLCVADRFRRADQGREKTNWLIVGALAMGMGTWAAHFLAMLALHSPFPAGYDVVMMLLSMVPAIMAGGFAVSVIGRPVLTLVSLFLGGVTLGGGFTAMHYLGMAGMRMAADLRDVSGLPLFPLVAAVALSMLFVGARFGVESRAKLGRWGALLSVGAMGAAIFGMSWIAMTPALFVRAASAQSSAVSVTGPMAAVVSISTLMVIGVAILASGGNRRSLTVKAGGGDAESHLDGDKPFWEGIFHSLADPVFVKDRDHRVVMVNDACCKLLGHGREALIGKTDLEICGKARAEFFRAVDERVFASGKTCVDDKSIVTADGAKHHVQTIMTLYRHPDGGQFLVGTIRDVSRRMSVSQAEESQLAAESAIEMKNQFLANMSHEIRSPMNGILGIAELLADTPLDHEQQNFVRTIERSAKALLGIINDILDFSKIEAGKLALETIPFDPVAEAENCLAVMAPRAYEKRLSLVCHVEPVAPFSVMGDPTRLRQIVLNFLSNAIKFTEKGEVVLRIGASDSPEGRVLLHFSISDTGVGIAPDQVGRLFEPFIQADASTTRRFGGTGLGLSICRRLAKLMGGAVGSESQEGMGSTFWAEIPFDKAEPVAESSAFSFPQDVVLVGGGEALRGSLRHYFEQWGSKVSNLSILEQTLSASADSAGKQLLVLLEPPSNGAYLKRVDTIRESGHFDILAVLAAPDESFSQAAKIRGIVVLALPVTRRMLETALSASDLQTARASAPDKASPTEVSATAALESGRLILVVEDNPVNQMVAVSMLKKCGYSSHVVSNGQEALDALAHLHYGLIFMDIQMPVMDGIEATQAIRRKEAVGGGHIPIVAMTANAMEGDRQRCLSEGMDDYISKPISVTKVKELLDAWLPVAEANPSPAADKPQAVVLDRGRLRDFLGDDTAAIAHALQMFLDTVPRQIDELRKALLDNDSEKLALLLDSFVASSENIGAVRLGALLVSCQHSLELGQWDILHERLSQLENERLALIAAKEQVR